MSKKSVAYVGGLLFIGVVGAVALVVLSVVLFDFW